MTLRNLHFACLLLLSWSLVARSECDQCQFTANDADDCKVYGKIDDRLIAWHPADADCLANYGVAIASINPGSVGCGSPTNVNSFVNAIKFGSIPNSVRAGLGVQEGGFFEMQNNLYVLKDSITVDGTFYNCEQSESVCYNAMKIYFAESPGSGEMMDVCETILNRVALDRETEQSAVRNQICTDIKANLDPPTVCGELGNQLATEVPANPTKDCSGFQFGPGTTTIPGCEGLATTGGSDVTAGNGGGSSSFRSSLGSSLALFVVMLLLANGL